MKITVNSQDLGYAGNIDTYQTFTGEGTDEMIIQSYNEEHDTDYGYDDFEWDYDHAEIVRDLATKRAILLETEAPAINSVKVKSTGSPREYNFSTDYAMFEIDYDEDMVEKFVDQDFNKWHEFYHDSGWWPQISWREDTEETRDLIRMAKLNYYLNDFYRKNWEDYDPLYDEESGIYLEHTRCKHGDEVVN